MKLLEANPPSADQFDLEAGRRDRSTMIGAGAVAGTGTGIIDLLYGRHRRAEEIETVTLKTRIKYPSSRRPNFDGNQSLLAP
jgi:hypothetical protein